jgi:CHAT domain-containing protein
MKYFYAELGNQENKALALQRAMMKLRDSRPHPYHWAPFILVGKVAPT